jgi:hypothetical protein
MQECDQSNSQQQWIFASSQLVIGDGMCLDVIGGSKNNQALLQAYTCNGAPWQEWELRSDGTIRSKDSGLCLDILSGDASVGASLQMYTCNGATWQQWTRLK